MVQDNLSHTLLKLFFKCNTNGTAKGAPRLIGSGATFRNHRVDFLGGFSSHVGFQNAFFAETMAAALAIEITHKKGW